MGECKTILSAYRMVLHSPVNPFPKDKFQTLPSSKCWQTTILNIDGNGRKFSKWVENTVGKGEIAHYDLYDRHMKNKGLCRKGLICVIEMVESSVVKRENAFSLSDF